MTPHPFGASDALVDPALDPIPTVQRVGWRRDVTRRRILAVADTTTVMTTGFALGLAEVTAPGELAGLTGVAALWVLLAKVLGLYDRDHRVLRHLTADELPALLTWAALSTGLTALATPQFGLERLDAPRALQLLVAAALVAPLARAAGRRCWRTLLPPERTIIVGEGPLADSARRKLDLFPDAHTELVGVVPDPGPHGAERPGELVARVIAANGEGRLDRLLVAAQSVDEELLRTLTLFCRQWQVKLGVVPPVHGMFGTAVVLDHVAELPVVQYHTWDVSRSTLLLKRVLDLIGATIGLMLCAPLLAGLSVAVRLDSPGPAFFRQTRVGQGGRSFTILKLRTMVADAEQRLSEVVRIDELDAPVFKLRADPRMTRLGAWLRRWSLDELPQLVNVLRGDMSLVGPRPEQVELVERYRPEHRFRLSVKPGLTGPMQVHGRGELSFEERLAVERDYVENLSVRRDIRILAMTLAAVVRGEGAY